MSVNLSGKMNVSDFSWTSASPSPSSKSFNLRSRCISLLKCEWPVPVKATAREQSTCSMRAS